MTRKLLKRKSRFNLHSKLKTVKRYNTSLSIWAKKQTANKNGLNIDCVNIKWNANSQLRLQTKDSSHLQHIYSIDQILCHQFDSKFKSKTSEFKQSLLEKKKIQLLYGILPKKQIQRNIGLCHYSNQNIVHYLESRLDVACKNIFVFNTLRCAQHWICRGRILVNRKTVTIPSMQLYPGDIISMAKGIRLFYHNYVLTQFYKYPKQNKYIQGGKVSSRWRDWAMVYNQLQCHKPLKNDINLNKKTAGKLTYNRSLKTFLYNSGRWLLDRYIIKQQLKNSKNIRKNIGLQYVFLRWLFLAQRYYHRGANHMVHSKYGKTLLLYKKHTLIFSRFMVLNLPLIVDGLYFLRYNLVFITKKNYKTKTNHKKLSFQKPMHLEVNYKNLSAIYLYPPQRTVWPYMIDFKLL